MVEEAGHARGLNTRKRRRERGPFYDDSRFTIHNSRDERIACLQIHTSVMFPQDCADLESSKAKGSCDVSRCGSALGSENLSKSSFSTCDTPTSHSSRRAQAFRPGNSGERAGERREGDPSCKFSTPRACPNFIASALASAECPPPSSQLAKMSRPASSAGQRTTEDCAQSARQSLDSTVPLLPPLPSLTLLSLQSSSRCPTSSTQARGAA